jgi:hypothetical protein
MDKALKCLINAVTAQVKTTQNHISGNATYQEFERRLAFATA